jgi:NitT/TauT family transport system permease protein
MPPVELSDDRDNATSLAHDADLAGLDRLELPIERPRSVPMRLWSGLWPKLAATAIFVTVWQVVVWSGWKPEFVLPGPGTAFEGLRDEMRTADFWESVRNTMQRAVVGFAVALLFGAAIGVVISRSRVLRIAIGSMLTGLQTMPSIAWYPLALVVFGINNTAIYFVVVIGAAPSIANGIVSGLDNVPPVLLRVGRSIGARGIPLYRDVVFPAAMPSILSGLKQGWAFSWRSLMAGELLVQLPGKPAIGSNLQIARDFHDYERLVPLMIVVFVIGLLVDAVVFGTIERRLQRNRGLLVEQPATRRGLPQFLRRSPEVAIPNH